MPIAGHQPANILSYDINNSTSANRALNDCESESIIIKYHILSENSCLLILISVPCQAAADANKPGRSYHIIRGEDLISKERQPAEPHSRRLYSAAIIIITQP